MTQHLDLANYIIQTLNHCHYNPEKIDSFRRACVLWSYLNNKNNHQYFNGDLTEEIEQSIKNYQHEIHTISYWMHHQKVDLANDEIKKLKNALEEIEVKVNS